MRYVTIRASVPEFMSCGRKKGLMIRTVAVFHVTASAVASWNCADGLVHALARMGYDVINAGNPDHGHTHVPLTVLQKADLILLSAPEWYVASLQRRYGHA